MRRVALCAILLGLVAGTGCNLTGREPQIGETARAQIDTLLSEAQTYMNRAGQGKGLVRLFHVELGEQVKELEERARENVELARDKCYEAYNIEPRWAPTNHAIAICEMALGQSDKAIEFARRTIHLDRERQDAWLIIGVAHVQKGQTAQDVEKKKEEYRKAIDAYETFVENRPMHMSVPYVESTVEYLREEVAALQ